MLRFLLFFLFLWGFSPWSILEGGKWVGRGGVGGPNEQVMLLPMKFRTSRYVTILLVKFVPFAASGVVAVCLTCHVFSTIQTCQYFFRFIYLDLEVSYLSDALTKDISLHLIVCFLSFQCLITREPNFPFEI